MVNECPLVSDPTGTAAGSFNAAPVDGFINELAFAVEKMAARVPPEQKVIDRLQAAADKINVDRSQAHGCVKECLLEAAKKMRLAAAATNEEESSKLNLRSCFLERLALGPFTAAAGYYSKADRAATPKAQELWREAGQELVDAAASLWDRSRFFSLSERVHFNRQEAKFESRARQCAEAAVCSERVYAGHNSTAQCALKQALQEAELQLRLALVETSDAVFMRVHCLNSFNHCSQVSEKLLTWCEQQQTPILTLPAPGAPPVGAEQQLGAERDTALRVERATWLCGALTLLVRMYATADKSSEVVGAAARDRYGMEEAVNQVVEERTSNTDRSHSFSCAAEAARCFLSGHTEECLVWCAAEQHLSSCKVRAVRCEVHNRLVVKAWKLREASGGDGNRDLALLMTVNSQDPVVPPDCSAVVTSIVDALLERLRQLEQIRCGDLSEEEHEARRAATQQLGLGAEYADSYLKNVCDPAASGQNTAELREKGERAMLAGRWYAAAAQAATAEHLEVHNAFTTAASYVKEARCTSAGVGEADQGYSDEQRPVATRAGERFAKAAEALLADDRELYELWLKAAEATAATLTDGGAGADAEALAQAAQQRQDAVSAHCCTTSGSPTVRAVSPVPGEATMKSAADAGPVSGKRKREGEEG
jgi:hypothetical protein